MAGCLLFYLLFLVIFLTINSGFVFTGITSYQQFVAPYVLQHRLILTAEAEMEGYSPVKVTQRLIDKVEVPK